MELQACKIMTSATQSLAADRRRRKSTAADRSYSWSDPPNFVMHGNPCSDLYFYEGISP